MGWFDSRWMKEAKKELEIAERTFGPSHAEVAKALESVAWAHYLDTNIEMAEKTGERALAMQEKELDPDHPSVAHTLHSLGRFCDAQISKEVLKGVKGDVVLLQAVFKKQCLRYERCLAIREKAFEAEDPRWETDRDGVYVSPAEDVARTMSDLGYSYCGSVAVGHARESVETRTTGAMRETVDKGLRLLERALATQESIAHPDDHSLKETRWRLQDIRQARMGGEI